MVCIYILYCIFTQSKEGFDIVDSEEERLGALATAINSPTNVDRIGNNPTGLIASTLNPITSSAAKNIQNVYDAALGIANSGPRIDDNSSLVYMIDFCYQGGKALNPFADSTFAANCGMCMTHGTLVDGRAGSNFGVVVYPGDKTYSTSQGIDAVPSSHAATCAPIIKSSTAGPNVTSVAINEKQYTATREYMSNNTYTITSGTGAGQHKISCSGTSNGIANVIKAGFFRDGAWDTHIGSTIDYTRTNLLTTTPLDASCIEHTECSISTSSLQWDAATLCGYPKPTAVKDLAVDPTKTTATSLTFIWSGGLNGNIDYSIKPDHGTGIKQSGNSVIYTGLTSATSYTFTVTVGSVASSSTSANTLDDRDPISNVQFTGVTQTQFTITWSGGNNAQTIRFNLSDGTNQNTFTGDPNSKTYTFTNLTPDTRYTVIISSTYATPGTKTLTAAQSTNAPPPPIPPAILIRGVQFTGVTQTQFTMTWLGGDNALTVRFNLSDGTNQNTFTGDPKSKMYTFTNLRPGTNYTITISSTYETPGTKTLTASQTTQSPPPIPPAVPIRGLQFTEVTQTQFTMSWSGGDNASTITFNISDGTSQRNYTGDINSKRYTFTGLSPATNYIVVITTTYTNATPVTLTLRGSQVTDTPPPRVFTCPSSTVNISPSFVPKQNNLLSRNFIVTSDFTLAMYITPLGVVNEWSSLLHMTTGQDQGPFGARALAIMFYPGTTNKLAIHIDHSTQPGWAARVNNQQGLVVPFAIGTTSLLVIRCIGNSITISVDDTVVGSFTHTGLRFRGAVRLYGSSPWYQSSNSRIDYLCYGAVTRNSSVSGSLSSSITILGGTGGMAYSTDGLSFTSSGQSLFPSSNDSTVLFISNNGSTWLAGGGSSSGTRLAISTDGKSWTEISSMSYYGGKNSSYESAIWTGNSWIVLCNNVSKNYITEAFYSYDGITWAQMYISEFSNQSQLAVGASIIVASGINVNPFGQHAIYYSSDNGDSWKFSTSANSYFGRRGGLYCLGYNGIYFLAGGCGNEDGTNPMLIYSSDGITWKRATVPSGVVTRIWALSWNGSMWLASAQYDGLIYSTDTINWTRSYMSQLGTVSNNKNHMKWSGSAWFVGTTTGLITSRDGINWTNHIASNSFRSGVSSVG